MDLQQLRYVVAVNRDRHFQKAALRSGVSQPTLSLQIQKLERELGAALFERSPHGVTTTPAGERFLPQATAILESLQKAVSELKQGTERLDGRIRLATIPTIGPYLLPEVIRHFKRSAPDATLELYDLTTSLLLEHLKEGLVDMGLLALPIDTPGIVWRSLGQEPFRLAMRRGHPLQKIKTLSSKDLKNERHLILQEGHCFRNQSLSFCKMSAQDPHIIFQGSSLVSVMRLAAAGEGVTLVPRMAAEPRQNPDLHFSKFSSPEPTREIVVAWRVTTPLSRVHQLLLDTAEKIFRRASPLGERRPEGR